MPLSPLSAIDSQLTENNITNGSPQVAPIPNKSQSVAELKSEKFLRYLFTKSTEKGYTPAQIVSQCIRIDQLEKKYKKSFEDTKNEFDQSGKEILARTKKVKDLEAAIAETQKKKTNFLREYSVNEQSARSYISARDDLASIGFQIDDLPKVRTCLFSVKTEKFNPETIVEKLNAIEI